MSPRLREGHPRIVQAGPILAIHKTLFVDRPLLSLAGAAAVYVFIVLGFGRSLEISSNYFVLLPVLAAALGYGLAGGLVAGALGLPANLLLFNLLGRPEFSPASKPIAELSGLLVGGASGYLAEYFRQLQSEIARRIRTEESLRRALEDKQVLLLELNHRVKNNLNVIKSLIQLQRNRSEAPEFREASDRLLARVFAIARAHDRMFGEDGPPVLDPVEYLQDILAVYDAEAGIGPRIEANLRPDGLRLPAETAVPLGLILNEAVANAWKYGSSREEGTIRVSLARTGAGCVLEVRDSGPGFDPDAVGRPDRPQGLGVKIIRSLAARLGGRVSWSREGGTRFRLEFPAAADPGKTGSVVADPGPGRL
ncbi:MAG TPA: sensor histidine kinase [Spirochaetia bacterium]|nr:sensor histidine kinase [Spirochaetia bacterium]